MAHVHGRPGNEREFLDDLLGRGRGDPDVHGYPGEEEASHSDPKAPSENKNTTTSEPTNLTSTTQQNQIYTGRRNKQ